MPTNILVTGSSNGFGRLTTLALARRGHTVVATMRDVATRNRSAVDNLRNIAEAERLAIHIVEIDVTNDASVRDGIAAALAKVGHLDAVINNAGYGMLGLAETVTDLQLARMLDTNVVGIQRVNRAVLPAMRERGAGLLVHVSSGLGRTLFPLVGPYAATKFAVEALAESYRYELKPTGIDVSIVQPGAFPTNFASACELGEDGARAKGYGPLEHALDGFGDHLKQLFAGADSPDPDEVANAIVALVETPAGKRPARVVVDRFSGQAASALNDAHANVQRALLGGMGMGGLAD
jgi:NAD(P)-dependent dehydrogenase (short-subunit alcohol dehydrogenase family)